LILAPLFGRTIAVICRRYTLTNKRIMIQRGLKPKPIAEVALAEIDDVRLVHVNEFFRCGDLEIVSKGQVKLKLVAVPEPDSFRAAILNRLYGVGSGQRLRSSTSSSRPATASKV